MAALPLEDAHDVRSRRSTRVTTERSKGRRLSLSFLNTQSSRMLLVVEH